MPVRAVGAFFGMDNLDPIAIHVLLEEWTLKQRAPNMIRQVCALGRLFIAVRLGLDCRSPGTQWSTHMALLGTLPGAVGQRRACSGTVTLQRLKPLPF